MEGVFNANNDGEGQTGPSQLFLKYRPVSRSHWKPQARFGLFYPEMSVENTDIGWLSKNFLNNSSINSWIGEELRVFGIEYSLRRSGRAIRSPWNWEATLGLYKGNDTTGTLLSWRGFSIHDRQSIIGDRINFSPIPGVISESGVNAPTWTEPFKEIDGNTGYYLGLKATFLGQREIRYYYYDNNANPIAINIERLYAWHTRFHSIAYREKLTDFITIKAQWLFGDTYMGNDVVDNDYQSFYVSISKFEKLSKTSFRIETYEVFDNDQFLNDPNNSKGNVITINHSRDIAKQTQLAFEFSHHQYSADRQLLFGEKKDKIDNQWQVALTFRW